MVDLQQGIWTAENMHKLRLNNILQKKKKWKM